MLLLYLPLCVWWEAGVWIQVFYFFGRHKPIVCIYLCCNKPNKWMLLSSWTVCNILTPTATLVSVQPRRRSFFWSSLETGFLVPGLIISSKGTVSLLTMGITKLADLIRSNARDAVSYKDISDYTGNHLCSACEFAATLRCRGQSLTFANEANLPVCPI